MQNENGCWNCARARAARKSQIWCLYWQAYFSIDYMDCDSPGFVPIVMNILEEVPDALIW